MCERMIMYERLPYQQAIRQPNHQASWQLRTEEERILEKIVQQKMVIAGTFLVRPELVFKFSES